MQKVYTELSQAVQRQINDNNAVNWKESGMRSSADHSKQKEFFHKYFKVAKDCDTTKTPCFSNEYSTINGYDISYYANSNGYYYTVTLANGAAISLSVSSVSYGHIDINGAQRPNIKCRDLFEFSIEDNGEVKLNNCGGRLVENGWQMDEQYDRDYADES